jgi:N-acetylglucosamine-6-phosphate deacetylase
MPAQAVTGGRVPTPWREIANGTIVTQDGRIEAVGPAGAVSVPPHAERLDAAGCTVVPGFIDIHVHGGDGADFMDATLDAIDTACAFHARGGTTALLATLRTAPVDDIVRALATLRQAAGRPRMGADVAGVHVEGPYFAPAEAGAQPPGGIKDPEPHEWARILAFSDIVKRRSTATMDRCVRTMVRDVGLSLQDAVKLATANPARFMRLDGDRGSITPGKRADLVVLDASLAVQTTVVGGRIVYARAGADVRG